MTGIIGPKEAALIKGMALRGDPKQEIAQYFGVNSARLYPILQGSKFSAVAPASPDDLPPRGPYVVVDRISYNLLRSVVDRLEAATATMVAEVLSEIERLNKDLRKQ